jgi:chromate transport protein ChrA
MNSEHAKSLVDVGSVGTLVATLAGWLPSIAALLTIAWTAIRIYESPTVQRLIRRKAP